jgi:hypothetical protein
MPLDEAGMSSVRPPQSSVRVPQKVVLNLYGEMKPTFLIFETTAFF